ncbi:hypothetical protein M404DRAFT_140241 [Pisolithus tinctorius Marx 270]|uniref:Uncharacterized protein n=1 Tax=Pisolithus tinctorius Marx 270 TaxID=870435 RepID=A0A0C3NYG5_PISTI|nr:hypothetical protein M404DRAFT_140241 [Pisolithus tinctorius Marx 270]
MPVYNADGSSNDAGPVCHTVDLSIHVDGHSKVATFAVTNTGKSPVIVGYNWLCQHNPSVDWCMGKVTFNQCPASCQPNIPHPETDFV